MSSKNLESPSYVDDGMKVIVPLGDGTRTGIWGEVVVAAGYKGRVKTSRFEKWFHIDDMRVEKSES